MIPVILSGGSGTRLWPVSRAQFPKQFCHFFDESLMVKTDKRLAPLGTPKILTVQSLRALSQKALPHIAPEDIIGEPMARNTAPAIALLCHLLEKRGLEQEVVGIFPADHWIADQTTFLQVVGLANDLAQKNEIVTLGIRPTYPATGYGYIESTTEDVSTRGKLRALRVKGFREKPDESTALKFVSAGNYYWNAGMFIFKVNRMIAEFKKHLPEMWTIIQTVGPNLENAEKAYSQVKPISIDYGIMEKLTDLVTIPSEMGWNDIGSWEELAKLAHDMNTSHPYELLTEDSQGIDVFSEQKKKYVCLGLSDVIVADTPDALMLVRKGQSQKIKQVVERLASQRDPVVQNHANEVRPWGRFDVLADEKDFKAKVITVDPKSQISYQSHRQRAEHWIVVKGQGEVVLDDEVIPVGPGKYIFIPQGAKHRLRNTGERQLQFVEVQLGCYFGEDDIIRYQDDYKRT